MADTFRDAIPKWSLLTTEQHVLHQWGRNLHNAFPHAWVLHVGSSLTRANYRDVDVRIVLEDDEYDALAEIADLRVLAVALSHWGQAFTRLPIDCQLQRMSENLKDDGIRNSIGGLPAPSVSLQHQETLP